MKGSKIGTIYGNTDGEGFIVWNEDFMRRACDETCFGIDVLQDVEVDISDALNDVYECRDEERAVAKGKMKGAVVPGAFSPPLSSST